MRKNQYVDVGGNRLKFQYFLLIMIGATTICCLANNAIATPIDLNSFSFITGDPVSIAPDGSSATISESDLYSPILLWNDLFNIPLDTATIMFGYYFSEPDGVGNDDYFWARLYDPATGDSLKDGLGNDLLFSLDTTGTGTITWSLAGASFLGNNVGMEFQLAANMGDSAYTSTVTVKDLQVNPVPEPASIFLLGSGLGGVFLARKKRRNIT